MFGRKARKPDQKHRRVLSFENLEQRTLMSVSPSGPNAPVAAVDTSVVMPMAATVDPMLATAQLSTSAATTAVVKPATSPTMNTLNPTWYTPANINAAYGYNNLASLGYSGAGQTVAIVVAFDCFDEYSITSDGKYISYSTNLQADLSKFDTQFSLPDNIQINSTLGSTLPWVGDTAPNAPPLSYDSIGPNGAKQWTAEWAREAAMDVEWVHAIAPKAQIDLIEAQTSNPADLLKAVDLARNAPGVSVVSMSWGFDEAGWAKLQGHSETVDDAHFLTPAGHTPVTFITGSGDAGGINSNPLAGAQYPASSPNVLAVGGTNLTLQSGLYGSETAWSMTTWTTTTNGQTTVHTQGSGGGISSYENQPSYMTSFMPSTKRTTPDVSFDADVATPVATYHSEDGGWGWGAGTSFGTQAWAGTIALVDQGRAMNHQATLGHANQDIYSLSANDFHDITSGSNGYATLPGYDMVTGRGTPKATMLVHDLVAAVEPIVINTSPIGINPVSPLPANPGTSTSTTVNPIATIGNTSAMVMPNDPVLPFSTSTDTTKAVVATENQVARTPAKPSGKLDLSDLLGAARNEADVDGLIDSLFASNDFSYLGAGSASRMVRHGSF
jgi:subtilase family serine protease